MVKINTVKPEVGISFYVLVFFRLSKPRLHDVGNVSDYTQLALEQQNTLCYFFTQAKVDALSI